MNQDIPAILNSYKNGVTASEIALAAAEVPDNLCAIEQRLSNVEERALDSDLRIGSGLARALEGVPFSVKANIDVAGIVTTNGTLAVGPPATKSARLVEMLCDGGAIPVFTTTMAELAIGAVTDNAHTGTCVTPADPNRHAGGSSGGSGASVAAGWVPFSLGSDTMGSVRIPAAYCGVFGYKPSSQILDRTGLSPLYPPMDTIGIIANTVPDIQSVLKVCARTGWDKHSDGGTTLLVPSFTQKSHSEVLANFNKQMSIIRTSARKHGYDIIELELDLDLGLIRRRGLLLCEVAGWKSFSRAGEIPEGISDGVSSLLQYGSKASVEKIDDAIAILAQTSELISKILEQFPGQPMLITPVTPFPYPDLSATNEDLATSADFTCLANICDLPAVSIPAPGQSIQIMAKNGDDGRLLEVAEIISATLSLAK